MDPESKYTVYYFNGFFNLDEFNPRCYLEERRANALNVREGDVFITTFPKSGTSWIMHALLNMYDNWGLLELKDRKIPPLLDYYYLYRAPDLELKGVNGEAIHKFLATANDIPSPRLIKTHCPPCLFPVDWQQKGGKVIYISRNPKDVCLSYFHFFRSFEVASCFPDEDPRDVCKRLVSWDEFVPMFARGEVQCGPWLQHVVEWRKYGVEDNVLHVMYEDLQRDMKAVFKKVVDFLGRPLSPEKLDEVVASCSLEEMKKNAIKDLDFDDANYNFQLNPFFRAGKTGNWKEHFTVAQSEMFDEILGKRIEEAGLEFTYEL